MKKPSRRYQSCHQASRQLRLLLAFLGPVAPRQPYFPFLFCFINEYTYLLLTPIIQNLGVIKNAGTGIHSLSAIGLSIITFPAPLRFIVCNTSDISLFFSLSSFPNAQHCSTELTPKPERGVDSTEVCCIKRVGR